VKTRKYPDLRSRKGLLGLPSIAFLDAEGTVLVNVPVDRRSVDGFAEVGARAREYVRLRAASARGEVAAQAAFLLMQLEERQVDLADATRRRQAWTDARRAIDRELLAAIDRRVVDLRIETAVRVAGQKERHTLGPRFLRQLREGPRPSAHVSRGFWFAILEWAERERDVAAFRAGYEGMKGALAVTDPGEPWVENLLARYRAKLDELRREKR
jgi:hypothetical protein